MKSYHLLLTTATFGVGFFMRPVGGILLGLYADHKGRKTALLLIIVLMTAAIAMIGFAPTYAAIGVAAPLIMPTFARTQLHLPLDQAFLAQSISLACMIVLTPLSGALSDDIGRKPIIVALGSIGDHEQAADLGAVGLAAHVKEVLACMGIITSGTISFYVILLFTLKSVTAYKS